MSAIQSKNCTPTASLVIFKELGNVAFQHTDALMRQHWEADVNERSDEIWWVEHPAVYSLGYRSSLEHLHHEVSVPIVRSDRGGEITYHGTGQLIAYLLFDLHKRRWGVKRFVHCIEQVVIDTLAYWSVNAHRRAEMPGVYIDNAKVASVGLKVRKGKTTHGVSINHAVDLSAFAAINPCGYSDLQMVNITDVAPEVSWKALQEVMQQNFLRYLGNSGKGDKHHAS